MQNANNSYRLGLALGVLGTLMICSERLGLPNWAGILLGLAVVACALSMLRQHKAAVARGEVPTVTPAQRRRGYWQALGISALVSLLFPFLIPWLSPSRPEPSLAYRAGISAFAFLQCVLVIWYQYSRDSGAPPKA